MAHFSPTIYDMLDALQKRFGAFPLFEDVPTSVLETEMANEALLDEFSKVGQKAVA